MFDRSVLVLLGLGFAALYGIGVTIWFGPENLTNHPWIEPIFWALATSGIVLLAVRDVYTWLRKMVLKVNGIVRRLLRNDRTGNISI